MGNNKDTTTRRTILRAIGAGTSLVGLTGHASAKSERYSFTHGVASGDPLHDRVILWTRVLDNANAAKTTKGVWQLSQTDDFQTIYAEGQFKTGPKTDHTVKVDVTGLLPGTHYFYRFRVNGLTSPVGRTRTLDVDTKSFNVAVVSCSNYSHGHFHVYKELAARNYDAVLHLGDYIYEYAEGRYDNAAILEQGRTPSPKTEIISLEDYRRRYAHYRSDADLQAAHAAHPFICVWDDHEIANDTWKNGAENHNDGEGDFWQRKKAAMRAYYEWLPIRETPATADGKIYRSFQIGNLASLIMLDTRHIGRDKGLTYEQDLPLRTLPFDFSDPDNPVALLDAKALKNADTVKDIAVPFQLGGKAPKPMTNWEDIQAIDPKNMPEGYSYLPDTDRFKTNILGNPERTILGKEQEDWLRDELSKSTKAGTRWQIIGQQLLIGKLGIPQIADKEIDYDKAKYFTREQMALFRMLGQLGLPLNLDAWDGYPACRERVFASIKETKANAILLAGDTHNAWAFDLENENHEPVGVELATPGITSPGLESYLPIDPDKLRDSLYEASPELKFAETKSRGWMQVAITPNEVKASWHFVSSVISPEYDVVIGDTRTVGHNTQAIAPR